MQRAVAADFFCQFREREVIMPVAAYVLNRLPRVDQRSSVWRIAGEFGFVAKSFARQSIRMQVIRRQRRTALDEASVFVESELIGRGQRILARFAACQRRLSE